jgi:hypothetical protein
MAAWRMAFRDGKNGPELWPRCQELRIAAIEYGPIDDIDFSLYPDEEHLPTAVKEAWSRLESSQRASFRHFRWEMEEKDIIYVKQGPLIVGKGVVGPYQFKKNGPIQGRNGEYWQHQRPVSWVLGFPEVRIQLGSQQIATVKRLTDKDVEGLERVASRRMLLLWLPAEEADQGEARDATPYVPKDVDRRRLVERQIRERRGQQEFRNVLRNRYGDRCMVTECQALAVLEAAHIKPYRGEDDNHPENGLLLRADIHTLFDLDLLGIEPDELRVELHPDIANEYGHLIQKTLCCTHQCRPSREALRQRYEQFQQHVRQTA